jgi:hypothetical protein
VLWWLQWFMEVCLGSMPHVTAWGVRAWDATTASHSCHKKTQSSVLQQLLSMDGAQVVCHPAAGGGAVATEWWGCAAVALPCWQ